MRRGVRVAAMLGLVLSFVFVLPVAAFAGYSEKIVEARDDFFDAEALHVPVGTTIEWSNTGRNPHTVTADDGSFDSGNLGTGATYTHTFSAAGAYRYFCRYHGAKGGIGMAGVIVVGNASLPARSGDVGPGREPVPSGPGSVIRVPADAATIQRAVDQAEPGDMVLISPGVYREAVRVTTPYLTIRGEDRNTVVLDGGFELPNGIHVIEADGVAIENMTARHYQLNGFYWSTVFGYRGSYLTAYDDGDYGVYAFDSQYGLFEHSYASGHPDSGFYIGQCKPCHAVIDDVVSEGNALGYSGTNAGGDLQILNSVWRDNMSGIVPNTLDTERFAPQQGVRIAGNRVYDNNNLNAPAKRLQYPSIGTGILVAGGTDNVVEGNLVYGNDNYGILVSPNLDQNFWIAHGNVVRDNVVRGSGRADLALSAPAGDHNCFSGNDFVTSLPPAIQTIHGCGFGLDRLGGGDLSPAIQTLALYFRALSGKYPQGDWKTAAEPPPQPTMPACAGTSDACVSLWQIRAPGRDVPGAAPRVRTFAVSDAPSRRQEVTVLGLSLIGAPTWWSLLLAVYAYLLPLILYVAWVSIALWDLIRRDGLSNGRRIGWMALVLLVPLLGPILYFAIGRSPIPRSVRAMLVAGGMLIYVVIAVLAIVVAGA